MEGAAPLTAMADDAVTPWDGSSFYIPDTVPTEDILEKRKLDENDYTVVGNSATAWKETTKSGWYVVN